MDPWELAEPMIREWTPLIEMLPQNEKKAALRQLNDRITAKNEDTIRDCDIVVAGLDGPDVDSGTASEIGFAFALGMLILGYRGDKRQTGDNEGATVNLQVEYWIRESGGEIYSDRKVLLTVLAEYEG